MYTPAYACGRIIDAVLRQTEISLEMDREKLRRWSSCAGHGEEVACLVLAARWWKEQKDSMVKI